VKKQMCLSVFIALGLIMVVSCQTTGRYDTAAAIEVIKLAATRERTDYDGTPIRQNDIVFYVAGSKVDNVNDFPALFGALNIKLNHFEITCLHNFIGYVSEHATQYRNARFELKHVYANLRFMAAPPVRVTAAETAATIEAVKLAAARDIHGYDGAPVSQNHIVFFVDGQKIYDYDDFPAMFGEQGVTLSQAEIRNINNFIGYVSEHAAQYRNARFELKDVYANLRYMTLVLKDLQSDNRPADDVVIKLAAFDPPTIYDGSPIYTNHIVFHVDGYQVMNLDYFSDQFSLIGMDLNILERSKISLFIAYIADHAADYKNESFNLHYVYDKYGRTGDTLNDLAGIKPLFFINNGSYTLASSDRQKDVFTYVYTRPTETPENISKSEMKVIGGLDSIRCKRTPAKDIVSLFGLPNKVVLYCTDNTIYVTYLYGEISLYFSDREALQEKKFLTQYGVTEIKYAYEGRIKAGMTLDEVLRDYGVPASVAYGRPLDNRPDVLYKNIDGVPGEDFIYYSAKGLKIYFSKDKITGFILCD
jgi:hypothetical protein